MDGYRDFLFSSLQRANHPRGRKGLISIERRKEGGTNDTKEKDSAERSKSTLRMREKESARG